MGMVQVLGYAAFSKGVFVGPIFMSLDGTVFVLDQEKCEGFPLANYEEPSIRKH